MFTNNDSAALETTITKYRNKIGMYYGHSYVKGSREKWPEESIKNISCGYLVR